MSRFRVVTWEGGGNVNPVLALCSLLDERGHDVTVVGPVSLRDRVEAAGARWDASGEHPADVVVVDYMLPLDLCRAEAADVPAVALVHTLYGALLQDGDIGPMHMAATVAGVNDLRAGLGLPRVATMADLLGRAAAVLVVTAAELDDPVVEGATYAGPVLEGAGPDAGWAPPAGDGPLVVVSLGTTPMDEAPVLQRVLDALAGEPVRVVATVGGHLDPAALRPGPNTTVSRYVRHAAVLPHASALVTHAGLGSVNAALVWGVPMVCLPLGREQPANAAAVGRVGAGRTLPPDAGADEIRAAVRTALAGPRPTPVDGSGRRAVELLESVAGSR